MERIGKAKEEARVKKMKRLKEGEKGGMKRRSRQGLGTKERRRLWWEAEHLMEKLEEDFGCCGPSSTM